MNNIIKTVLLSLPLLIASGCQDTLQQDDNQSEMQKSIDLSTYTKVDLTNDQTYALAFMWHEEKLAFDIYNELNKLYPTKQFENIANKSEIKHIELVQNLVEWYDINITNLADYTVNYSPEELANMPVGQFAVPDIQALYDTLYAKGKTSAQSALEVGCMVEVTDVNDLDEKIALSTGNAAVIDTFNILRDGSYNHYWAFDKGLINMGIGDGCCSLGATYCHKEYPQNSKGQGKGSR